MTEAPKNEDIAKLAEVFIAENLMTPDQAHACRKMAQWLGAVPHNPATPQVRVKPLKFVDEDGDGVLTSYGFGTYVEIYPMPSGMFCASDLWPDTFPTIESAIAAYQADHEARILSCIEIVPAEGGE